jgi:hypothetical protein
MAKKITNIKYTSRDFNSIKQDLVEYAKRYYPDNFRDFSEASFGSLMLDSVAYVGDILSYYTDYQANESFLETALEYDNIIKLGKQVGFKYNNSSTTTGLVTFYAIVPANTQGNNIDTRYLPIIRKGAVLRSASGIKFLLNEDVNFKNTALTTKVEAQEAADGKVVSYAVRTYGKVISGELRTETIAIGDFERFKKVELAAQNVTEIVSIFDSEGNEYYEVDNLSQNIIYKNIPNNNSDNDVVDAILKPLTVPRRFVTEVDSNNRTFIVFGASSEAYLASDESLYLDPKNLVLNISGKRYVSDTNFDPTNLIENDKMGVAPSNTTITITYRFNTVANPNVGVGEIVSLSNAVVDYENRINLNSSITTSVSDSIQVDNEDPIVGSVSALSSEELKNKIKGVYAAQNRAVTTEDYKTLCYNMPSQYGSIKRVAVAKDINSPKRNLNIYIISERNSKLSPPSISLKNNLKTWLSKNKMINDTVDILDGKIINYEIIFTAVADPEADKTQVLSQCISRLQTDLSLVPEMGEPFLYTNILSSLKKVSGLVDVVSLELRLKQGGLYSDVFFNIKQNTTNDGRIVNVPINCVMELKYPSSDIKGTII